VSVKPTAERIVAIPLADFPPGSRMTVEAFGTTVALFNIDGRLFAVDNHCPHQGGPLCHGRISGALLPSLPYEYRYGREGRVLNCPWHSRQYDIETGESLIDSLVRVPVYDVRIEGEEVMLYESPRCPDQNGDDS